MRDFSGQCFIALLIHSIPINSIFLSAHVIAPPPIIASILQSSIPNIYNSKNKAILTDNDDPEKALFIGNNYNNLIESLNRVITLKPLFFCINDDQRDINKREQCRNAVLQFFTFYFTNKPSFEK